MSVCSRRPLQPRQVSKVALTQFRKWKRRKCFLPVATSSRIPLPRLTTWEDFAEDDLAFAPYKNEFDAYRSVLDGVAALDLEAQLCTTQLSQQTGIDSWNTAASKPEHGEAIRDSVDSANESLGAMYDLMSLFEHKQFRMLHHMVGLIKENRDFRMTQMDNLLPHRVTPNLQPRV